ncbi:MAG: hypothetical protein A2Z24_02880 [Candidatus Woykebacteria bacterium RBG_16_44_10]|uniref:Uncharacterized protein n=1 Tax=Candidatus Woykebacteria bacterium RBG_16_44_10 TaxID=1802597 RepID=A0A1G1WCQ4_9BACT|nr:MAG: hypothetical protein A2Z24_02880 [Candidatus Woykebacteria bacterium RBG_16_44_10]
MPRELGYKDAGDRVIVINAAAFGQHGKVLNNDGFGEVLVALENGRTFHGYEGRDLIYEDEPLPDKPVEETPGPVLDPENITDREGNIVATLETFTGGEVVD